MENKSRILESYTVISEFKILSYTTYKNDRPEYLFSIRCVQFRKCHFFCFCFLMLVYMYIRLYFMGSQKCIGLFSEHMKLFGAK